MKKTAKQRKELYAEALSLLKYPSTKKIVLLYHLIYSSKLGDDYILYIRNEIKYFVVFIHNSLNNNE